MNKKLKNIRNIFVRYRNPYQSLHKRFVACEQTGKKYEQDIIKAGENPTFLNILKYIRATGFRKLNPLDNNLLGLLDRVTDQKVSNEELQDFIDKIKKNFPNDVVDISLENRDGVSIQLKDRIINGETLSSKYPKIGEYYPNIRTLNTRKGKCHAMSMALAHGLSATIATGSFYTITPKARFLHSWVEEDIDGEIYCHDFTYNISLKQEDYYKLFHVIPYEKIHYTQLQEDTQMLARLLNQNEAYSKLYLSSRDEALEIAEKLPEVDLNK